MKLYKANKKIYAEKRSFKKNFTVMDIWPKLDTHLINARMGVKLVREFW